jgi:hypothetical protein
MIYSLVKTSGLYYKSFTIVIYDCNGSRIVIYEHNDSGQYYNNTILAKADLCKDCKIRAEDTFQIGSYLTIVITMMLGVE